jgi:hypothetical protein
MVTRRRGVKHTRRRRRHHTKTNKRLSKRYRGRKGYNKRITRRRTRRSRDTEIVNTQSGGFFGPYSEAKTAAGKIFEQVLLLRYFLKRAYESQISGRDEPLKGLEILKNLVGLSPTEQHDLPQSLVSKYNEYVSEISHADTGEENSGDVALVTSKSEVVVRDDDDRNMFERIDDMLSGGVPEGNYSAKAKKLTKQEEVLEVMRGKSTILVGEHIDSADAMRIFTELFKGHEPYFLLILYYVECPLVFPNITPTPSSEKKGRLLFSVQLQQINIRDKIGVIRGSLTDREIEQIFTSIEEINKNIKDIKDPRKKEYCELLKGSVNHLLKKKDSLLQIHMKIHTNATSNRLQCTLQISRDLLERADVVIDPLSPGGLFSSTPKPKPRDKEAKFSRTFRGVCSTPELHGLTFLNVLGKTPEQLGQNVLCRFKNNPQALRRIYSDVVKHGEDIQELVNQVVSDKYCIDLMQEFESQTPKLMLQPHSRSFAELVPQESTLASQALPAPLTLFPQKPGVTGASARGVSAKPSATSGRRKKTPVMSPAMSLATTMSPAPLKRQRTPSLAMLSASAMPPAMLSASAMPPAMLSAMPSASSGTISKKPRTPTPSRQHSRPDVSGTSRNAAPKSTSSTRGNHVPPWILEQIAEMEKR